MIKPGILLTIFLFVFLSGSVIAQTAAIQKDAQSNIVVFWLEGLIFVFITIVLVLNGLVIRKFKSSVYGTPFIYLFAGLVLLGLCRLLILLYDLERLKIADVSLQIYWHLLFYLGMILFLVALSKIISTAKGKKLTGFNKSDSIVLGIVGLLALIALFSSTIADRWLVSFFEGSILDRAGIVHFAAFAFAGFLAIKLFWVHANKKYSGSMIAAIILPFFIFLAFMSVNHFWELLTESWKVISVPEATIERVEQFFWLPAFMAMTYGFIRLRKEMAKAFSQ